MGAEWGSGPRPSSRRQRVLILALSAGLAGVAWWGQPDVDETKTSPDIMSPAGATVQTAPLSPDNVPDGECHEDMECWDCETMGNLICGPRQALPVTE